MSNTTEECPLRGTAHCQETAARYEVDPREGPCRLQGELVCRQEMIDYYARQLWAEVSKPLITFADALTAAVRTIVVGLQPLLDAMPDEPQSWHERRGLCEARRRRSGRRE